MPRLNLVVRLWLHPEANIADFEAFEREAAQVIAAHGGRIERAFRNTAPLDSTEPCEVHLVSFPDEAAFAAYRSDTRTADLAKARERLIARTEIWTGTEVNYGF